MTVPTTNDGAPAAPRLVPLMNPGNLAHLPAWSKAPASSPPGALVAALRAAGFAGGGEVMDR